MRRSAIDDIPQFETPARIHAPVYRCLKELILSGKIPPGTKLPEEKLAEKLGVSRTPLREAISLLAQENILRLIPRRGAYTIRYTKAEIIEILELREVLEGLAARLAVRNLDEEAFRTLRSLFSPQRTRQMEHNLSLLAKADARFHEEIVRTTKNHRLIQVMTNLYDQMHMVRLRTITLPGRLKKSIQEHRDIMAALLKGDPDLAEECARRHIRNVRDAVLEKYQGDVDTERRHKDR